MNKIIFIILGLFIPFFPFPLIGQNHAAAMHLSIPKGHSDMISSVKLTIDEKNILSSSFDGTIKLWDIRTGLEVRTFRGHKGLVFSIAVSPINPRVFVSASRDNKLILWDIETGAIIHTLSEHEGDVMCVDFSSDGLRIISGGSDLTVKLWDALNGNLVKNFINDDVISSVRFIPGTYNFITTSGRGNIKLWNEKSGKEEKTFYNPLGPNHINWIPNSTRFVVGSAFGTITEWDLYKEKVIHTYKFHTSNITGLDVSKDGKFMATVSEDKNIIVWDLTKRKRHLIIKRSELQTSVAISNQFLFTSEGYLTNYENFTIYGWDFSGHLIQSFEKRTKIVDKVYFINNGTGLLSIPTSTFIGRENQYSSIWNVTTGEMVEAYVTNPTTIEIKNIGRNLLSSYDERYTIEYKADTLIVKMRANNKVIFKFAKIYSSKSFCFSPVEDILAVTERENIVLWHLGSQKIKTILTGHSESVEAIQFSPKGNLMVSGSKDNTVKIWDINKAEELVTLVLLDSTNWLTINKEGYYYASKSAAQKLGFSNGVKTYTFDQYDLRFNRPDKVLKTLGIANDTLINLFYSAYQKRLNKMNFSEKMFSEQVSTPEVKILGTFPLTSSGTRLVIPILAVDSIFPLDRINVFINDVPIYGVNGINIRSKNTQRFEKNLEIELSNGKNKIQISALNQAGVESFKESFNIMCTVQAPKPNLYFVGLGVSEFKDNYMNLNFPAKDIRDLVALLVKAKQLYNNISIDTFLDNNLKQSQFATLKQKLLKTKTNDHIIFFIAGHGVLDDSLNYYLATYDTDFKNPKSKAIAYEVFENLLDSIPARQKLMLIDACNAGEIDKQNIIFSQIQNTVQGNIKFRSMGLGIMNKKIGMENSFELMKNIFVDLRRGTGATIIASAGGVEAAIEVLEWKNSIFMFSLLSGLKQMKADLNHDGAIMLSELQKYLLSEVRSLSAGVQQPTTRTENVVIDWRVW